MESRVSIYPYFVNINQMKSVINTLNLPFLIVQEAFEADAILAIRSTVKQNSKLRRIARSKNITIYTIFTSTIPHISRALYKILGLQVLSEKNNPDLYQSKVKKHLDT